MANTFAKIASVTVGSGGASSIDFTSIPSTYTDLVLFTSLKSSFNNYFSNALYEFNGVSSGYSQLFLYSQGTVKGSFFDTQIYNYTNGLTGTTNTFTNDMIYIPNYTSSNYKSFWLDNGNEFGDVRYNNLGLLGGVWSNTAPITSIKVSDYYGSPNKFIQYSTASLYGIKNS